MFQQIDKQYWSIELDYPLSPSVDDFFIFKNNLIQGTTLLLGCTHKLLQISNNQLDIDPWYKAPSVIKGDWRDNKTFYDNVVGDGVFNFTKELTDAVLLMASNYSKKLIVRSFSKRLPLMKIADYFPKPDDFCIEPNKVFIFSEYNFYIWNFNHDAV